jgi:hypothetical protein
MFGSEIHNNKIAATANSYSISLLQSQKKYEDWKEIRNKPKQERNDEQEAVARRRRSLDVCLVQGCVNILRTTLHFSTLSRKVIGQATDILGTTDTV